MGCRGANARRTKRRRRKKKKRKENGGPIRDQKKKLSLILREEAAILGVERKALGSAAKHTNLWPKAVLESLDDSISNHRWESALKIFGLLRKQQWYQPRSQTYARLLTMLGKCRQPEYATSLFDIMLSEGHKPTLDVYTSLVGAYGRNGLLNRALDIINEMKTISDCKPDAYTYTVLINCCCKLRQFDLIPTLLTEMSYLGIECSTVTYNTIIDGYGKARMLEEMESSLCNMLETGSCLPDVFTMNSIIWAYGDVGRISEMEKWYDEFQHMGIEPDVTTFNILIKSYGKDGMYEKMGSVLKFMKERFFSPTTVTFNIIIECFGRVKNIERMEYFFQLMKVQGVKPNSITYCSLVNAYSRAGYLEKVPLMIRQIENSDVILDTPFFNCVISAYGQAGEIKIMEEMFLLMKGEKCEPDSITFASMVQAYRGLGMDEAAQEWETKMNNMEKRVMVPA